MPTEALLYSFCICILACRKACHAEAYPIGAGLGQVFARHRASLITVFSVWGIDITQSYAKTRTTCEVGKCESSGPCVQLALHTHKLCTV
eukprot:1144270-Pelagomonas_calceolata.AAC.15